jgi:hypothetical protein
VVYRGKLQISRCRDDRDKHLFLYKLQLKRASWFILVVEASTAIEQGLLVLFWP